MHRNGHKLSLDLHNNTTHSPPAIAQNEPPLPLEWDWEIEHADRKREAKADAALRGAMPFQVDRRLLKDVVREKMSVDVGRITFLSSGTFHKAYLVALVNHVELVARVARRFMPRLKTESEVATMNYLRENTDVPVPIVHHYDSNPYNRLGGEYILESKAPGVALAAVYHSLGYNELVKLVRNLADLVIPLFAHRFSGIGSLYHDPNFRSAVSSSAPTPKASQLQFSAFPFSPAASMTSLIHVPAAGLHTPTPEPHFHVGPIVSWPFFGSNRGDLAHPGEIDRGPWSTTQSYLASCAERETTGVIKENAGQAAPHRIHLDPDEIRSSRHHQLRAVPGDESDESDEWDLEESEEEWEGPGDAMYRDYRRMQRTTFLVAHLSDREVTVRREMARWMRMMERLAPPAPPGATAKNEPEQFGLDCHDLSLENIFVDTSDHTKITCIIDWESTTTRPLWQCAHLPAFLQSSPFTSKLFRQAVERLATPESPATKTGKDLSPSDPGTNPAAAAAATTPDLAALAREWLHYESVGARLRIAHRFVEWDGWEEGLVDTILGPEDQEEEWLREDEDCRGQQEKAVRHDHDAAAAAAPLLPHGAAGSRDEAGHGHGHGPGPGKASGGAAASGLVSRWKPPGKGKLPPLALEKEKEQMLNTTGDICGGRGGELGLRLEAWLTVAGGADAGGSGSGSGRGHAYHGGVHEVGGSREVPVGNHKNH